MRELGYRQRSDPWTFKNTRLSLWRFVKPIAGEDEVFVADILVPKADRHIDMINRAERHPLGDCPVAVIDREDLIEMKQDRGSPQDLADIENLRRDTETNQDS